MKRIFLIGLLLAQGTLLRAATEFDLTKGVDLTGTNSVNASILNQLVDNARPGTNKGFAIRRATRPDVTNHPRYTNFLWLDIASGSPVLKFYTGTGDSDANWISATVGAASIGENELATASVTAGKIAANAVSTSNLVNNAVTDVKIAALAINNSHLQSGSVSNANLADQTVAGGAGGKIAYNTITGTNIADGGVSLAKLASDSVNSNKIVNAGIDSEDLKDAGVTTAKIADGAVSGVKILTNAQHLLLPKVLLAFNGRTAAADAILKRYNVASVASNGLGDFTVTFANALADTNYIITASTGSDDTTRGMTIVPDERGTTTLRIRTHAMLQAGGSYQTNTVWSLAIFGD